LTFFLLKKLNQYLNLVVLEFIFNCGIILSMQEDVVPYPDIIAQLQNAIKKHRLDILFFCVSAVGLLLDWFEIS
jgi:hypothetical protein